MTIPGLIDLQVNGYKGVDFSGPSLSQEDVIRLCQELRQAGTTAFLPTVITSSTEVYRRNLPIIAAVLQRPEFRRQILGIHLEGPFISPEDGARGAHQRQWTRRPDVDYLKSLIDWADGTVRLITIAAELPGAKDLAGWAAEHKIAVSLGHQMASGDNLDKLAAAGARALTHLGNGMPAMIPRHDNAIWAGLANDDLCAMIITDGHHLPASVLKTIVRTKGPSRCIVVSDASPVAGWPPGQYDCLGIQAVLDESGKLYNPATGYMVGSAATLQMCVNHLASLDLASEEELTAMVFDNPLRLIGVDPDFVLGSNDADAIDLRS